MYVDSNTLNVSYKNNFCHGLPEKTVPLLVTGAAATAIYVLAMALLAHFHVLSGINALTQWSLMGGASAVLVVSTIVGTLNIYRSHQKSPKVHEDAYKRVKLLFKNDGYETVDSKQLSADISSLTTGQLEKVLKSFFHRKIIKGDDPLKALSSLSDVLPQKALENLIQAKYPTFKNAAKTAKKMIGEANYYLGICEGANPTLHARFLAVQDTLVSVLDSIFNAFGVAEFFKPSDGTTYQSEFKFQKIMMLVSFFTLLTATLLPLLGVTTGASIVGGLLLLIAILSVVWPRIRPMISQLPHGENWTRQVQLKQLWTSGGRKESVREIAESLIEKKHPLIIGPSGIGKTQTVVAFTEALERGDFPELQGKTVFYFNTADIVGRSDFFNGGNDIFKKINEIIGRHRDNCILVFDEIHLAYQLRESTPIGEQLKTFLDEKHENSYPHVICLTTEEEYYRDIYKDNAAADRRFVKVEISNTDKLDTEAILHKYLIQKAPELIVEPGALEYLINETQELPQPLTARRILMQCITKAKNPHSLLVAQAEEIQSNLEAEYARGAVFGHALLEKDSKRLRLIQRLEKQLSELKEQIELEKKQLEQLDQAKKTLAEAKKQKYRAAIKCAEKELAQANQFLLLKYYVEGALEDALRSKSAELNAKSVIDKALIKEVLEEEAQSKLKREEALKRGRAQLKKRNK